MVIAVGRSNLNDCSFTLDAFWEFCEHVIRLRVDAAGIKLCNEALKNPILLELRSSKMPLNREYGNLIYADLQNKFGVNAAEKGQFGQAEKLFNETLKWAAQGRGTNAGRDESAVVQASSRINLAIMRHIQGKSQDALRYLPEAVKLCKGEAECARYANITNGRVLLELGRDAREWKPKLRLAHGRSGGRFKPQGGYPMLEKRVTRLLAVLDSKGIVPDDLKLSTNDYLI